LLLEWDSPAFFCFGWFFISPPFLLSVCVFAWAFLFLHLSHQFLARNSLGLMKKNPKGKHWNILSIPLLNGWQRQALHALPWCRFVLLSYSGSPIAPFILCLLPWGPSERMIASRKCVLCEGMEFSLHSTQTCATRRRMRFQTSRSRSAHSFCGLFPLSLLFSPLFFLVFYLFPLHVLVCLSCLAVFLSKLFSLLPTQVSRQSLVLTCPLSAFLIFGVSPSTPFLAGLSCSFLCPPLTCCSVHLLLARCLSHSLLFFVFVFFPSCSVTL
jgi:hypothetical protein